jgi:hypothetical protein
MKVGAFEFLWNPADGDVDWERRWETGLSTAAKGSEEREVKRTIGLKSISYVTAPYTLEERLALGMAIREGLSTGKACAPYWGRGTALAADVTATTITLVDNLWGFAAAEFVFLLDPATRGWEVRSISGVAGSVLTLSGGSVARTYKSGLLVWPLIFGKLICENWDAMENHRANPRVQIAENDPGVSKSETSCPVAATYLGRPIAPVSIDWSGSVRQSFTFDLNEAIEGFGKSDYSPTQDHVVNGWEFTVLLNGTTAIKAWDCLTAALPGRASGFWLQDALALFQVLSAPASDKVRVRDSGLAETWAADPAVYVIFTKPSQTPQMAKITAVSDIGGGIEEVTLDASLTGIDSTWQACRLRYLRLADDVERGKFLADGIQYRSIVAIELPQEYAGVESGLAPIWLYTFWIEWTGGVVYWRHTSNGANVTSNGNVFSAANISHGDIKRSMLPESDDLEITGFYEAGGIFALCAAQAVSFRVWVQVDEATQADPDTTTTLFVGLVMKAAAPGGKEGRKVSLKCAGAIDALGADAPTVVIGNRCQLRVYGPGCLLSAATFEVTVTLVLIGPGRLTIQVSGAGLTGNNAAGFDKAQDNYWAWGWIAIGTAAAQQIISILKHEVIGLNAVLHLSRPLPAGFAVGATMTLTPGCDGLQPTCGNKFDNYLQFLGMPYVPEENPNLPDYTAVGSKK